MSRPVELALTAGSGHQGSVRLRAEGPIRCSDFGLEWEALHDFGRLLVADEVRLLADVAVTRVARR